MSVPRLSVIMAAWKAEETIAEAIDSVLTQTMSDFEFIIIDDGSQDGTTAVVREFSDRRIRLFRNGANIGLTASLNRALLHARTAFIARMDADDRSHPTRLATQMEYLLAHPKIGLLGASFDLLNEVSEAVEDRIRAHDDAYLQRELLKWNPFCHGSVVIRAEVLSRVSGYDESFPTAMDYDLWLRLAEVTRIAILPDVLYAWRVRADSMSHAARERQLQFAARARQLAWERRIRGVDELGRSLDSTADPTGHALRAEHCVIWGREAIRQGKTAGGLRLLGRAARLDPLNPRLTAALRRAPGAIARGLARRLGGRDDHG